MTSIAPAESGEPAASGASRATLALSGLSALGIVFGDIGTSPLYTLKTAFDFLSGEATPERILGILSLLIWTLFLVTSVKYVLVAMSIDNDGEGGILALMSLLGVKLHRRPVIIFAGLLGAALIYGDGAITPAISVLSALEGLDIAAPELKHYVVPAAVAILLALFAVQPLGTSRIGAAFGPIMALWFVVIGALGLWGIARDPAVLVAVNPYYGLHLLATSGLKGFTVLGGIFLCVTGAEALYADMGHFGRRPIRFAWSWVVFPCLVLNYAGQSAIALRGEPITNNIFYHLCPQPLLIPLVFLATVATIIASQSIITGAFSMTRQAIQLGWLPRMRIKQTSEKGYGQIYVGVVNWLLMLVTVALTILFHKSDDLAAAYGIAVSLTMLMTSCLLFIAMREIWRWSLAASAAVAGLFMVVDAGFFAANSLKIADGGYVPLLLAAAVCTVMLVWHRGIGRRGQQSRAGSGIGAGFPRRPARARYSACAGNGGLSHPHLERRSAGDDLASQAQSRAARVPPGTHGGYRFAAAGAGEPAHHGHAGRRQFLAGDRELRLHRAAQHPASAAGGASRRLRRPARRRDLLRRSRTHTAPRARCGAARLAGGVFCRDVAERFPRHRLFPPAERTGGRDRPPDLDLVRPPSRRIALDIPSPCR